MNIVLWVLQILLALHTLVGAVWKFKNSDRVVPSVRSIPRKGWLALGSFELLCSLGLVLPMVAAPLAMIVPLAAAGVGADMLLLCGVHLRSGATRHGPMVYWLVVAALCAVIVVGRLLL